MIVLSLKKFIFRYQIIWFSKLPNQVSSLSFSEYRQCASLGSVLGFFRSSFHTLHIDISKNISDIFDGFDKNTKYEIRRAIREGANFLINENYDYFIDFYNKFAKSKSRELISRRDLDIFGSNLLITMASHEGLVLVMHSYVLDTEGKKARLLHSASDFRSMPSAEDRSLVGRANRFLHYSDMLYLKNCGFSVYDFGGIDVSRENVEKAQISSFKFGFGGMKVSESNFISYPLAFCILIPKFFFQFFNLLKLQVKA
jgi:hypothetical protein